MLEKFSTAAAAGTSKKSLTAIATKQGMLILEMPSEITARPMIHISEITVFVKAGMPRAKRLNE